MTLSLRGLGRKILLKSQKKKKYTKIAKIYAGWNFYEFYGKNKK